MSTTAVATLETMDPAYLAELAGMVRKEEIAGAAVGPAVLKINYDEESTHGTGVWVVGQKKDKQNNITEQGWKVTAFIMLATRLQRSYYDEKNAQNCFSTKMYDWGGSAPDNAEFNAKLEAIGKADHKGNRIVCFGRAILPDGNVVDCVSYFGGTAYMPFKEHYEAVTKQTINGKRLNLPPFVCVTMLPDPDKGKNGARTYYIAKFAIGQYLEKDLIIACGQKREEVYDYIDNLNNATSSTTAPATPAAPVAPPTAPPVAPAPVAPVADAVFVPQTFDLSGLKSAAPTATTPAAAPAAPVGMSDLDLEAAINAAL